MGSSITWTNDYATNGCYYNTVYNIYIRPVANVYDAYEDEYNVARRYLRDFTYEYDATTDKYILTGWKGTYNGEPSNRIIIPDIGANKVEI